MPELVDALDQMRAHDPARSLAPLSPAEREAKRDQIIAAGPPNTRIRRSLRYALRRRQRQGRRLYMRRWVVLSAGVIAVVAALVGIENVAGGGAGHTTLSFAVPPAAAAQLKRVAHVASVQAMPVAGQWEYLEIKLASTGTISTGGTTFGTTSTAGTTLTYHDTQTVQTWYAPDGDARQRITNDSFSFATRHEQATYLADESAFARQLPHHLMLKGVFEDKMFPSEHSSQAVWVTSPPSDPEQLITEIWNQYVSATGGPHQPGLKAERPEVLWDSLTGLLLSSTSARLRATAYSALAYVPDTTVLGSKTDQLGRSGIAISFTHDSTGTIQTLIVSPATGDLLELDRTQKRDGNGMRTGTLIQRELFLRRAIVAAAVALPGGGYQPLDPPQRAN